MQFQGKAWVFGDDIDTDVITPGRFLFAPVEEAASHAFEAIHPDFPTQVRAGDIIVAGNNFGCGSARENAPYVLKFLGVACILAENFARTFFRNAIAVGMPVMSVAGLSREVAAGDELMISFDTGKVIVKRTGRTLEGIPLHPSMHSIILSGGINGVLSKFGNS